MRDGHPAERTVKMLSWLIVGLEVVLFLFWAAWFLEKDTFGFGFVYFVLPVPALLIALHAIVYFFSFLSSSPARRLLAKTTLAYNFFLWVLTSTLVIVYLLV